MSNEEEAAHLHGLLNLMKDRPTGYYIADEGAEELGFSDLDSIVLMRRLESEKLAITTYATNMALTPLGLQIARGPGGYQGHLTRQAQELQRKDNRESRSALGSSLSGWAGVAGLFISSYSLWDSHQTSSELDALRQQVHRLTQVQARDSTHLAAQQKLLVTLLAPAHQNQASTLSTPATKSNLVPTPAHKPTR